MRSENDFIVIDFIAVLVFNDIAAVGLNIKINIQFTLVQAVISGQGNLPLYLQGKNFAISSNGMVGFNGRLISGLIGLSSGTTIGDCGGSGMSQFFTKLYLLIRFL